ncbi:MAG: flagellar hook-associated protein 2 [Bacillota bacterium]
MRVGGLASGMDIDSLVADLMKAERIPLDKLTQKKQVMEWQRDDYRSINTMLSDLDSFIFNEMTLQKDFLKKKVSSSDSSIVTTTAGPSAGNISTSVEVKQLASSTSWVSGASTYTPSFPFSADTEIELKVTNGDGTASKVKNSDGTETDVIKLTIKAGATLEEVLKQLSNKRELGITAFAEAGKVSITKNDTGSASSIMLQDNDAKLLFESFGLTHTAGVLDKTTTGADAKAIINGLEVTRASNTFSLNDITYTLHQKSPAGVASKVSVSGDTDNMVDKIVKFVDKYNGMIEKIDDKLSEKRYRNYQPLSDEEKESMSEKQVEMWEERAKSGLIRNDSILSGTLTKLRTALYTPFNGTGVNENYKQLSQIGISSLNWQAKGKLTIDEDKLRAAIEDDPNAVYALFNETGSKKDTESQGLLKRVRETISDTVESIEKKAGKPTSGNNSYMLGRMLDNMDSQIDRFQDRLIQVEDRYWKQFTAMEKAIQQSNQQSMYLMNQFGGGM